MNKPALLLGLSLLATAVVADDAPNPLHAEAIESLHVINNAQRSYARAYPEVGFACDLARFAAPRDGIPSPEHAGMLEEWIVQGGRNGYSYILFCGELGKPQKTYRAAAVPAGKGPAFCTDQSGSVRSSDDGKPGACFSSGKPVVEGK